VATKNWPAEVLGGHGEPLADATRSAHR
jgi:hypothetical protein